MCREGRENLSGDYQYKTLLIYSEIAFKMAINAVQIQKTFQL